MTARRLMSMKAMIRVASSVEVSDQMLTAVLMRFLRTFLNDRRYGRRGIRDWRVIFMVGASDRFSKR